MSLWRNRNFLIFLTIQALSVAGDSFSAIAVPLLVLQETGSVVQMGLLTGTSAVASLLAGTFAGVIADRFDRRRLLILCDVVRAVLFAAVPVVWFFSPQIWLLYVIMPLAAAIGMLFQVTYVTVVPALVDDREQLTQANSRLYAVYALGGIGGPALAGLTSQLYGPAVALGIDALTFAVSAVGLLLVRLRPAEPVAAADRGGFFDGARFLFRQPVLRALTILLTCYIFLTSGLDDIVIYYLKHDLRQNDDAVGLVLACGAVGSILGASALTRLRRRFGFGGTWIGAVSFSGLVIAAVGVGPGVIGLAAIMMGYFLGQAVAGICSQTLRQEITPSHLLGRVTSAFWTIHFALGPAGAALLTLAVAGFGVPAVMLAAGAGIVLIAVAGSLTPVRRPRPEEGAAG
ncbi:MFS transporter [Nonomuraea sp. NPDC050310]|uniref:MFS transporter n=1 Tax=unclassified Nonomuraea TaxID=2593643 RepID=UPI0033C4A7D2